MAEEKRIENRQLSREELRYGQGTVAEKGKKVDKGGETEEHKPHEMFGRHSNEIGQMHGRHGDEMAAMHKRHMNEHKDLMKRHHEEHTARLSEISRAPEHVEQQYERRAAGEKPRREETTPAKPEPGPKPKQETAPAGKKPEPGPKPKDKSEHATS